VTPRAGSELGVVVRAYEKPDRGRVREVCFRTGYMGEPIDWQWRDAESFADLFTSYYTDREPESAFVVEVGGLVVGYLLGCTDTRRAWTPSAVGGRHLLRRGLAFRPGTARVVWRGAGDVIADLARRRIHLDDLDFSDPRWPAHLHIDLLPEARGVGAGRRLMRRWLDTLRSHGISGCHLQTFAENSNAIAFFEAAGFHHRGAPVLAPGMRSRAGGRLHLQVMVRTADQERTSNHGDSKEPMAQAPGGAH
jgi:ribosomal protein S18 acetylase RimI-like enzyme